MTQADRVHSTPPTNTPVDPTRRRFLTVAAGVVAAMASSSATAAIAAPDPIFAAIDAFYTADAACVAMGGDIPDEVADRYSEAYDVVLRTCPTTPAGLAALTSWARERANWLCANSSLMDADNLCTLTAAIDDGTRGMAGLQPWSPTATRGNLDAELFLLADEYTAAYQNWSNLNRAFDKKYGACADSKPRPRGYRKAEREVAKAETAYIRLEDRIAATPAVSVDGMRAKVRSAKAYMESGKYFNFDSGGCPEAMAQSIFADIMRLT